MSVFFVGLNQKQMLDMANSQDERQLQNGSIAAREADELLQKFSSCWSPGEQ